MRFVFFQQYSDEWLNVRHPCRSPINWFYRIPCAFWRCVEQFVELLVDPSIPALTLPLLILEIGAQLAHRNQFCKGTWATKKTRDETRVKCSRNGQLFNASIYLFGKVNRPNAPHIYFTSVLSNGFCNSAHFHPMLDQKSAPFNTRFSFYKNTLYKNTEAKISWKYFPKWRKRSF